MTLDKLYAAVADFYQIHKALDLPFIPLLEMSPEEFQAIRKDFNSLLGEFPIPGDYIEFMTPFNVKFVIKIK